MVDHCDRDGEIKRGAGVRQRKILGNDGKAMLRGNPDQIRGARYNPFLSYIANTHAFPMDAPVRSNDENVGVDLQVLAIPTANVDANRSIWKIA